MMNFLKADLKRYFRNSPGIWGKLKTIMLTQGIWATIVYRAGSWCHQKKMCFFPLQFFMPVLTIIQKLTEIATGIQIPFTAKIGKGLYIGHFGCIIISPKAQLGDYCNISQGVTIGQGGREGLQKTPVIGDRVYIAPGAKLFGGIIIGNDVAIGANAVVTKDLPDSAVAVGVPAAIINFRGSKNFVIFDTD